MQPGRHAAPDEQQREDETRDDDDVKLRGLRSGGRHPRGGRHLAHKPKDAPTIVVGPLSRCFQVPLSEVSAHGAMQQQGQNRYMECYRHGDGDRRY